MARVWKWLKHPAATGVLLALLIVNIAVQHLAPTGDPYAPWGAIRRPTSTGNRGEFRTEALWFHRADDGSILMIDEASDSLGEVSSVLNRRPRDVVRFTVYFCRPLMQGPWAAVERYTHARLWMSGFGPGGGSSFTVMEIEGCKVRVSDWLKSLGFPKERVQTLAAAGEFTDTEPLWWGYVYNVASFVLVVMFLRSLSWVPRAPAYLATTRRARRLARGQCPQCRYSVVGLKNLMCPECGGALDRTAKDLPV